MSKEELDIQKALDLIVNGNGKKGLSERHGTDHQVSSYSYGVEADSGNEFHIRNYLFIVKKRWKLILSLTILVTAIVAVSQARKPDIFEARSQLLINRENENSPIAPKEAPIFYNNDPIYFNTQAQILSSPVLLRRVAKTLDLEHNKAVTTSQPQQASRWQRLLNIFGLGSEEKAQPTDPNAVLVSTEVADATPNDDLKEAERLAPYVGMIAGGLQIERVVDNTSKSFSKETRLVNVRYTSTDPQLAAKIVNAVADAYVLHNLEQKTASTKSTKDYLAERVAKLQNQIKQGEEQSMNYIRNHPTLAVTESQNTVVEKLVGLNKQLLEAENQLKGAEAELAAKTTEASLEDIAEKNKEVIENKAKITALGQKRTELLVKYTEEHKDIKQIDEQIAFLDKAIKGLKEQIKFNLKNGLKAEYEKAKALVEKLRADFNNQKAETMTQNEAAINYRIIQQEIETNKKLLDNILQSARETDVVRAGTPNNVMVTDYALSPKSPIGPQRRRMIILSFLLALGASIVIAFFLEFLNDTVTSVDDVEKKLHLPAIGVIPQIGGKSAKRRLPGSNKLAKRNSQYDESSAILVNGDSSNQISEAYRHLRTSVLLSTAGGAPKSLLISSSVPAEGKTTTAVNTATSLAQTGVSVVIIDADMRRPRLHRIFNKNNDRGLSTILSRPMHEGDILNLIQQHAGTGLYVLPSGPIPPNPAELIGSEQMRKLVTILEAHFTHVVIDSPPIASFTDSVLISAMVDGTLLVVQSGKTSMSVVKRTKQIIQDVGGKIFGVVLNNINVKSTEYYYYHRYYSSYYEKEEDDE